MTHTHTHHTSKLILYISLTDTDASEALPAFIRIYKRHRGSFYSYRFYYYLPCVCVCAYWGMCGWAFGWLCYVMNIEFSVRCGNRSR